MTEPNMNQKSVEKIDFDDLCITNCLKMIYLEHMSIAQASHYHPSIYEVIKLIDTERLRSEWLEGELAKHKEATLDGDCQVCDYESFQAKIKELQALLGEMKEAIIWMAASEDFNPGGQARGGFEKIVQPALARYKAIMGEK